MVWQSIVWYNKVCNIPTKCSGLRCDGNGRTGRLILFRECSKNGIVPVVIEDTNRNEYLEALKEYRKEEKVDKLVSLFKKEQPFCLEKCIYFM